MIKWFTSEWWKYLLEPRSSYYEASWSKVIRCRAKGHPCGVVWYNPGGLEPDMHCRECGDDLG